MNKGELKGGYVDILKIVIHNSNGEIFTSDNKYFLVADAYMKEIELTKKQYIELGGK